MEVTGSTRKRTRTASQTPRKRTKKTKAKSTTDLLTRILQDVLMTNLRRPEFALTWVKLSMVNKFFHATISADLSLWRFLFFHGVMRWPNTSWLTNYRNTADLQCNVYRDRFRLVDRSPERLNASTDLAPVSFYKKSVQMWCVRSCGMCGNKSHNVTFTWVLGMHICRLCAQANLVSHQVLWEDYGINLYSPAPTFAKTQALLANPELTHMGPIASWLPMRVWFFKSYSTKTGRWIYTSDPRDFTQNLLDTPFLWKPHLSQYVDFPALQDWAQQKKTAAKLLTAVVKRNFAVALRNKKRYKKDQALAVSVLKTIEVERTDPIKTARISINLLQAKIRRPPICNILNNHQDSMPDPWIIPERA
jgi:hypothetical protein